MIDSLLFGFEIRVPFLRQGGVDAHRSIGCLICIFILYNMNNAFLFLFHRSDFMP